MDLLIYCTRAGMQMWVRLGRRWLVLMAEGGTVCEQNARGVLPKEKKAGASLRNKKIELKKEFTNPPTFAGFSLLPPNLTVKTEHCIKLTEESRAQESDGRRADFATEDTPFVLLLTAGLPLFFRSLPLF